MESLSRGTPEASRAEKPSGQINQSLQSLRKPFNLICSIEEIGNVSFGVPSSLALCSLFSLHVVLAVQLALAV